MSEDCIPKKRVFPTNNAFSGLNAPALLLNLAWLTVSSSDLLQFIQLVHYFWQPCNSLPLVVATSTKACSLLQMPDPLIYNSPIGKHQSRKKN